MATSEVPPAAAARVARLIDDRPTQQLFRIDRGIYTDPEIFELELAKLFEGGWIYLCHEDQLREHGDYYSTHMGRQPVFAIRRKDGSVGAYINACAHRGALLTPMKQGRATTLTCRFHGWCYNAEGRCTKVKDESRGWPDGKREAMSLTPVPRVESYRGFVFASLAGDVPDLAAHLGNARLVIDLLADQSPGGLEIVRGRSSYIVAGNWKLQAENGVDGYHVSTVHRVFAAAMAAREQRGGYDGLAKTEAGRMTGAVPTGSYDLGNGHIMIWAGRANPEAAPLYEQKPRLDREFPPERVRWMLARGRNLLLFPNMLLMDQPSTQIRLFRPLAVDRTEVTVYCVAPRGESAKSRAARLRKFEDFYLSSGMATPDDLAALEDSQAGSHGRLARWNEASRGMHETAGGGDAPASELGLAPAASTANWDFETLYHGFYRQWLKRMSPGGAP
jgi:benzoate/toluate 1,2-dioxygenase subunit alpha